MDSEQKDIRDNVCEEQIYSALFRKHARDLHNFLYYKYGANFNPEDLVQDAFIKLWENCAKVTPSKARAFLFTVANNLSLNVAAHNKVKFKFQQVKPKSSTNESPEFLMEQDQYMDRLQGAIEKLSEAQRTAFLLNRIEGKKHREIAEMLGISTKAVEKRLYSAIKKIKEDIKEFK